jgi:L-malate glycosyltransferase
MRVLYISHFFVSSLYQRKLIWLSKMPNLTVAGVTPKTWVDEGMVHNFELPSENCIRIFTIRSYLTGNGSLYFLSPVSLFKIFKMFKPDIIHVDEEPWSLCMLQVLFARGIICQQAKLIFDTSENIPKPIPFPFSIIQQWTFQSACYATAINSEAKIVLKQKGFHGPIKVVGHGVDPKFFFPDTNKQKYRRMLELSSDDYCIGYVGILTRRKGVQILLNAFARLRIPNSKLILVGSGPLENEIKQRIRTDPRLKGRVILVGSVPHVRIPDYLRCLDVLVLPSLTTPNWKEQFGRVLIEAMACGVPVIGSNSGGIPEVINDAGLIFSEGNDEELTNLLIRVFTDRELRNELIHKGLQRVSEKYTWEKIAQELYNIYAEILHC